MDRELIVPPELEGGSYASELVVWSTASEFTLDFAADLADGDPGTLIGTARVRVPVTMMFEFIRRMNERLTAYEERYGDIGPPQESQ